MVSSLCDGSASGASVKTAGTPTSDASASGAFGEPASPTGDSTASDSSDEMAVSPSCSVLNNDPDDGSAEPAICSNSVPVAVPVSLGRPSSSESNVCANSVPGAVPVSSIVPLVKELGSCNPLPETTGPTTVLLGWKPKGAGAAGILASFICAPFASAVRLPNK